MRAKKKTTAAPAAEKVLVLRTCAADMSAHGGFIWPKSGPISAPDWKPTQECGNGLHGLLWGEGNGEMLSWASDAAWLVVEVEKATIIDLDGKVKFPSCVVVHCGNRKSATEYLAAHGAEGRAIAGGTATAGEGGSLLIKWWDGSTGRYRACLGEVGIDGIKADAKYRVESGKLVEVKP